MKNIYICFIALLFAYLIPVNVFAGVASGTCVEGDCENGYGTRVWDDNDGTYVGEFKNGKEHGHGSYTMPNGYRFEGEFKNGKREGYGESVYKDGREIKGYWKNDAYIR